MHREYNYKGIKPAIICEHNLSDSNGHPPTDYKFFCFNGEPEFIQIDLDRFENHRRLIYGPTWIKKPFNINFPISPEEAEKPGNLTEMLELARKLSAGFPFIRVDLYSQEEKILFEIGRAHV